MNQDYTINSGQILVDGITISNVNLNGYKLTANTQFPVTVNSENNILINNGTIELINEETNIIDIYGETTTNVTTDNITIQGVDIVYDVHVKNLGLMNQVTKGCYAGTMHLDLPIEAIHIGLTGENASNYFIQY